jgi:hypothetical protein
VVLHGVGQRVDHLRQDVLDADELDRGGLFARPEVLPAPAEAVLVLGEKLVECLEEFRHQRLPITLLRQLRWPARDFKVGGMLAGGNKVWAEIVIEFKVKATGKILPDEQLHLWTLDDRGQVVGFRHYLDTAKHIEASTP